MLVVHVFLSLLSIDLCVWPHRYCSGKRNKGKKGKFGWDYSGASHIAELHALLRATVMVSDSCAGGGGLGGSAFVAVCTRRERKLV